MWLGLVRGRGRGRRTAELSFDRFSTFSSILLIESKKKGKHTD